MHAVFRSYSGPGAHDLLDMLTDCQCEFEADIRQVAGFKSWSLIRTDDGCMIVTICADKKSANDSREVTREWLRDYEPGFGVGMPLVADGPVASHVS